MQNYAVKEEIQKLGDKVLSKVNVLKKKAKIKLKKEVAKGTLLVKFSLLEEKIDFKPGQFFYIELPPHRLLGEDKRRHFTISNSPNEKYILSLTTRIRDSGFKKTLKVLPLQTEVEVGPIAGSFTLPEDSKKPLVFVALGIGITPYISMLRYIQEEKLDYKIALIYSDSDLESFAYLDEIKKITARNPNIRLILTVTKDRRWKEENRHVDGKFIKDYVTGLNDYSYYISGPPKAVDLVEKSLKDAGIEDIKSEEFSGY